MSFQAWTQSSAAVTAAGRADPEFFAPSIERVTARLREIGATPLSSWATSARRGVGPNYDERGGMRVVKTANIRQFELRGEPDQYVTEEFAQANLAALAERNSLLVTSTGVGSAGRAFVNLGETVFADGHITILTPPDSGTAAYLCAYLQSPVGRQQLIRHHRGSSRQIEIYPSDIMSILVPCLPTRDQAVVADRWLAAVRGVGDSARASAEVGAAIARAARVDEMLSPLGESLTWTTTFRDLYRSRRIDAECNAPQIQAVRDALYAAGAVPLSHLVTSIRKGFQPSGYDEDGRVVVVKSKDVLYPGFDLDTCDRTSDSEWPYYLAGGELLVNSTGLGTLGRATVVPMIESTKQRVIAAVDVMVIDIARGQTLSEYIALYLNSQLGRALTAALQTGSSGQQHLYPSHLMAVPIWFASTSGGEPDFSWLNEIVCAARARATALNAAHAAARLNDEVFSSALDTPVDMSMIPR